MSRSKRPTDLGRNRTGIKASSIASSELALGARLGRIEGYDGLEVLKAERIEHSRQADPVGTMPLPASLTGGAKAVLGAVKGEKTTVFLDLMGERLAFERTGCRLYEALMVKRAAADPHPQGPTPGDLQHIRDQELEHFKMLWNALERLGADPTAMTPGADVVGTASSGLLAVLADPHTTLNQGLKVILMAELADADSWVLLADMALELGQDELAADFQRAADEEEEHVVKVRAWAEHSIAGEAGVELGQATSPPAH